MSEWDLIEAVQRTVAYADIFACPLTCEELHRYLIGIKAAPATIEAILPDIHNLACTAGYVTFRDREWIIERRQQREEYAKQLWTVALHYGQLIGKLPFVRMVAVTGSLAVNNVERSADIDYLVVTAPGYLWLCRLFIVGLVKVAARQGITLCPNYLITENALLIEEQNLFTARELVQMVPVAGLDTYARLRQVNTWTQAYLPNANGHPNLSQPPRDRRPISQNVGEIIFSNPAGRWLDRWEMQRKIRKLMQQRGSLDEVEFTPDMCKGHFDAHQRRIMQEYSKRLDLYLERAGELP